MILLKTGVYMTKIENAIQYAVFAHAGVSRKGKERPYILHPIEAMTIVAGMTDDEDVIAATVLHDVAEDTSLQPEDIERLFGKRVRDLVMAESEDKMRDVPASASWKERKQATIDHLGKLDRDAKLICLGDKLANIREINRDYATLGNALWERFNIKDKALHAWYYTEVCDRLAEEFGKIAEISEYRNLLGKVFS